MALKTADRSATFTFCQNAPFLAAGSVAGAIDLSFSTSSQLEIFSLDLASPDRDLKLAGAAVQAPERFARLAWSDAGLDHATYPYGLLAGGLSDGSVCTWNPAKIIGHSGGAADARGQMLCRLQKHQGAVRGLEFNPFSANLLASGAADGDLCIWDVGNPAQPSLYPAMKGGSAPGQAAEITCLSWNRKVQHILGTATNAGTVVVWDLKKQRPVISFRDPGGRRRCSSVAWNPEVATQLVVASDDDASPALQLWDLRNSVSPLMEMYGHAKGVLAVSWCPQDANFLLSSGKDNRIIVWDVATGQPQRELPPGHNWRFDVQWAPGKQAGVFAGATFEGQIALHTLASCQPSTGVDANGYAVSAGVGKPPAWMKRPVGASFGFGGKLVKFSNSKRQLPTGEIGETATIEVQQVQVESAAADISEEFQQVIRSADRDSLRALCESRAASLSGNPQEAETWAFLQTHFEADGRNHLLSRLGFADALPKAEQETDQSVPPSVEPSAIAQDIAGLSLEQQHHAAAAQATAEQLVAAGDDGSGFFSQSPVDGNSFFDNLQTPRDLASPTDGGDGGAAGAGGGGGASIAASGASAPPQPPSPKGRAIIDGIPGESEKEIQAALLVGNYASAVEVCLKAGRHADALIAASLVGGSTWDEARLEYMHAQPRPYMRVVHAVLSGDWEGFIAARPPQAWRESLAALLTSAPYEQFESLVGALASRLATAGALHPATLCYVCSGDVESAVRMWTRAAGKDAAAAASREAVMEKAVVLGLGVDRAGASSALGDLLARHAEELATAGRLSAAYDLLCLVPSDSSSRAAVLKDRLYRSGAAPQAAAAPPPFPFAGEGVQPPKPPSLPQQVPQQQQQQQASQYGGNYGAPQQANGYTATAPVAIPGNSAYGGGSGYGASAAAVPQPPPPHQHQQQQYGGGGYGAAAQQAMPQQQQPAVFQPQAPSYSAPPTTGPATFHPPPPQQAPTVGSMGPPQPPPPAAPMVFQPQAPVPSVAAPPMPSPRMAQQGPPPTVFQPSAAPPAAAVAAHHHQAPPPQTYQHTQAPPPVAMPPAPQAPPPTVFQPSPASMGGAPTPAVYPGAYSSAPGPHAGGFGGAAVTPSPRAPPTPPPPQAPAGPPAGITVATADTSAVPPEMRAVASSLTALFQAAEAIIGGHPAKRRELDDASRKIGGLLWRLNAGEVSPSVAGKLQQLCGALDAGDYATAGHVQVMLTTSDWDECSAWLTALKRLIKVRQMGG